MQHRRHLVDIRFVGGSARDRVHHPRGDIHPDMRLHPEVPLIALPGLVHLGVAGLLLVLGRGRRRDDGRIDNGALTHQQPALFQKRPHFVEQHLGQCVPLQPMTKMQHRRRVRHPVHRQIDPGKAAQCLAVVQRILQRLVRQPVPLLHEVEPQHPLQPGRRPPALALRIERPQARHQPRPRHHKLHLGQNLSRRVRLFLPAYSACEKLP